MKGVKAIYETNTNGPVKVRALAIYSTCNGLPLEVICRVTSKISRVYPTGYLIVLPPAYLWERHRYVGNLRCYNLYQGRPDLSGLPRADEALLKELTDQRTHRR